MEPLDGGQGQTGNAKLAQLAAVSFAFTPSAPVDDTALFSERNDQVLACIDALYQRGMHIALYGERGVGKTSLANVLPKLIKGFNMPGLDATRIDCNTNDDFASIWKKVFRALGRPLAEDLALGRLDPEEVRFKLQELPRTLIVIDEFDRVEDDESLSLLADTIKTLSDHSVESTLMLVGVADSVEALIGEHDSVVRSLAQIPMPRMSESELDEILTKGFQRARLDVNEDAKWRIIVTAEGLPHFVHLIALHAGQSAVQDDRTVVRLDDVARAEASAVKTHSVLSEYRKATQSPQRGHLFEEVLLACAFTPKDDFGHFRAGDIRKPLSMLMGREITMQTYQRHLNEMARDRRGNALLKEGEPRHHVYRFRNPLLQPFTKIVGRTRGLLTTELQSQLETLQRTPR
jgi:Cdc6-like AAA superfamily ATPase